MSELSVLDAPLAKLNEDWGEFGDFQQFDDAASNNANHNQQPQPDRLDNCATSGSVSIATMTGEGLDNAGSQATDQTFAEMSMFSGSLEDLVNTFDEKITNCFRDYDEDVEHMAPVQVRTQDEILSDCQ